MTMIMTGWQVIRKLEQEELPENVELLSLDRPGPALLDYLRDCELAILIDAFLHGWLVGWAASSIKKFSLQELLDCAELQGESSHQPGIADSLQHAVIAGMNYLRFNSLQSRLNNRNHYSQPVYSYFSLHKLSYNC